MNFHKQGSWNYVPTIEARPWNLT